MPREGGASSTPGVSTNYNLSAVKYVDRPVKPGDDRPQYGEAHPFRFFAFTAIAAAAVRFSTPSLE